MESRISTKLTKLLGIRTPIVCPAMAQGSGGLLAANVTAAGGFGFIGAGYGDVGKLKAEVELARSVLDVTPPHTLPIGIGYLSWQLEQPGAAALDYLNVALEYNVQAVWLSFGETLGSWVTYLRSKEPTLKIFILISTTEQFLQAINEWKADVIIAQGNEAGGHGLGSASSLITLLSEILFVGPDNAPPILAAGGLVDGNHLASVLALGASGAVFGTRFLLSPESLYSEPKRSALIAAKSSFSVRSTAFDQARNTLKWPRGVDGRGLRNNLVEDFDKGVAINVVRANYSEALSRDDPDYTVVWAGTGVGLMNKSQLAKDIVIEIHEQCIERLRQAASLIE